MGAEKKTKGRNDGRQRRHAPTGYRDGRSSQCRAGTRPRRARGSPPFPSAARIQARGCKGRSPLHKKTKILPLPAGKGVGGMGAKKETKGRGGRVIRRQRKQAPRRVPLTPAEPATQGHAPRRGQAPFRHRHPTPANKEFEKSSGGFGGLFQESPGASLSPLPPPQQLSPNCARMYICQ